MLFQPPDSSAWLVSALLLALCLSVAWLVARRGSTKLERLSLALNHRAAPLVAGTLSSLLTLSVWGSPTEPPLIHDEAAYLVQAQIFASGRWGGPVPPIPEFFEQAHVFVEPQVASKYPPGHSLLLVPGVLLGLPGLVPLLAAGVAGALLFSISRRISDSGVALMTWTFWSTSGASLIWRASYMSQSTSTVLWLAALFWLHAWVSRGLRGHLVLVVIAMGWLYLTRPLTAIGLAVPMIVTILGHVRRRHQWTDVRRAAFAVIPVAIIQLVWQKQTLGHWWVSPYAEYSRQYFPFVKPGFGVDPTPPARAVPPEIAWVAAQFLPVHAAHRLIALPAIVFVRTAAVLWGLGQAWRAWLVLVFALGASRARGAHGFALASAASLVCVYLVYAHPALWIVYYAEVFPVFFLIVSFEIAYVGKYFLGLDEGRLRTGCCAALLVLTPVLLGDVLQARQRRVEAATFQRTAAVTLSQIADERAVVFVRYPPSHNHHDSLIVNGPDYRTARLWLVYDRGTDNERLLAATDRPAYLLDTASWTLERLR